MIHCSYLFLPLLYYTYNNRHWKACTGGTKPVGCVYLNLLELNDKSKKK